MSNKPACDIHAAQRAKKRFDLDLTFTDLRAMSAMVGAGKTILLEKQPNGTEKRALRYAGKNLFVIVAPEQNNRVITVLKNTAMRLRPKRYRVKVTRQTKAGGRTDRRREKDAMRRDLDQY